MTRGMGDQGRGRGRCPFRLEERRRRL